MKTQGSYSYLGGLLCGCLLATAAVGQTVIQDFEYANDADLLAAWTPQMSTIGLSPNVAPGSTSTKSLSVNRFFAAASWDAETISGPVLTTPVAIAPEQYVTLSIAGDPQFTNATYRIIYVYAYDSVGNFGRWGSLVPVSTNWTVLNMLASGIAKPWDSTALPALNDIVQFKIVIYGQGELPGTEFNSTIYIDDLVIRAAPVYPPAAPGGVAMMQTWEYASDFDLAMEWHPGSSLISLSPYVATGSTGTNSLKMERYFSTAWDTEVLVGPQLPAALVLKPEQYITIRVAGDPEYAKATFNTLFVYAFDGNGNFGRWGSPVPASTNWQIFNFRADTIAKPWNSLALPELNNIIQFQIYVYGQGDPPGEAFASVTYIDDLQVRDAALVEFPPPSPMRTLIDNFESYADDTALLGFYSVVNSGGIITPSLETPAPQGNKALKMSIDFSSMQYPWAAVRSATVPAFSFPANATVQCKFKGDPGLAPPIADGGTSFWLTFYDEGGRSINFNGTFNEVFTGEWTTIKASYNQFWSGSPTDTGNLVQWRLLVQGWTGTAEGSPGPLTGVFYVDDVQITIPPTAAVVKEGTSLTLQLSDLISGTTYTIRQTEDFAQWTTAGTIQATGTTATWPIPAGQKGFYQVSYTP